MTKDLPLDAVKLCLPFVALLSHPWVVLWVYHHAEAWQGVGTGYTEPDMAPWCVCGMCVRLFI
jgi:hypothetical protein